MDSHSVISIDSLDLLDLMASLLDKSLVIYDEQTGRYRMLESIRQYGRHKLADASNCSSCTGEEEAIRSRHLDYFRARADEAALHLRGPDQAAWLDRLETDYGNLRAALEWCLDLPSRSFHQEDAVSLANALIRFWQVRSYTTEGRSLLSRTLSLVPENALSEEIATTHWGVGVMAWMQGDIDTATERIQRSLEMYRALDRPSSVAAQLGNLAVVHIGADRLDEAHDLLEESLRIQRESRDPAGIASSLLNFGELERRRGNLRAASGMLEESLERWRELGNSHAMAVAANNLGRIACDLGELARAEILLREALVLRKTIGDKHGLLLSLLAITTLKVAKGDLERACRLLSSVRANSEASGLGLRSIELAEYERNLKCVRSEIGEEMTERLLLEGGQMSIGEAVEDALRGLSAEDVRA
jgi:Predicted ATPase